LDTLIQFPNDDKREIARPAVIAAAATRAAAVAGSGVVLRRRHGPPKDGPEGPDRGLLEAGLGSIPARSPGLAIRAAAFRVAGEPNCSVQ